MAIGDLARDLELGTAAEELLLERLRAIPGASVSDRTPNESVRRVFHVQVYDNLAREMAVYQAEREVYQLYPEARFEVQVA